MGSVATEDVGEHNECGRLCLLSRVAVVFQKIRPRLQVLGDIVGRLAEVVFVLGAIGGCCVVIRSRESTPNRIARTSKAIRPTTTRRRISASIL